jgi:hypothetical protein
MKLAGSSGAASGGLCSRRRSQARLSSRSAASRNLEELLVLLGVEPPPALHRRFGQIGAPHLARSSTLSGSLTSGTPCRAGCFCNRNSAIENRKTEIRKTQKCRGRAVPPVGQAPLRTRKAGIRSKVGEPSPAAVSRLSVVYAPPWHSGVIGVGQHVGVGEASVLSADRWVPSRSASNARRACRAAFWLPVFSMFSSAHVKYCIAAWALALWRSVIDLFVSNSVR